MRGGGGGHCPRHSRGPETGERRTDKAKRELGYTNLMVRQIADGLGFAEPAYFTRFFLKHTGRAPTDWREHGGGR